MTVDNITKASPSREQQLEDLLRLVQNITSTNLNAAGESEPRPPNTQTLQQLSDKVQSLLSGTSDGLGMEGFRNAVTVLSENSVNNSAPGFLGKLVSAPSPPGIAADLLLSVLNNNGHVWRASPALTTVEKHVSGALARQFGLDGPHAGGITVPGGAAANMLALLVARNIASPDSKTRGIVPGKYVIFVADSAHYSVSNAAQIVGLGSDSVITVPSKADETIDCDLLEAAVNESIKAGRTPLLINATAGNTVNGTFDDIQKAGAIARKANTWFHVDACWGGAVAFSDKLRHLIDGMELADSIAFNPHKMLGVPLNCAFLLANDLRMFWLANKLSAGYLFHDQNGGNSSDLQSSEGETNWRDSHLLNDAPAVSEIRDLASLTVQCTRRSDATKFFLHWIYYGTTGIANEVEQAVDSAKHLARLVNANPNLSLIGDVDRVFAQVCFYWRSKDQETATINSHNTRVLYEKLTESGWKIDFAPYKERGECIRIACNRLTTRNQVEMLVVRLAELGETLGL